MVLYIIYTCTVAYQTHTGHTFATKLCKCSVIHVDHKYYYYKTVSLHKQSWPREMYSVKKNNIQHGTFFHFPSPCMHGKIYKIPHPSIGRNQILKGQPIRRIGGTFWRAFRSEVVCLSPYLTLPDRIPVNMQNIMTTYKRLGLWTCC